MVDFSVLPPEVNSGRMYAGSGSAPLVAAASAWDGLAVELGSASMLYRDVVAELTGQSWQGPASASMVAAAEPYVEWMNTTAAQAGQVADQVRAAAAAYEAAFAATVPPSVVAANRSLLASLVATNVVGQNSAAIAANQAEYAEMWAQDAAAMFAYSGSARAATVLPAFSPPPASTNPAGQGAQAAAAGGAAGTAAGNAAGTAAGAAGTAAGGPVQSLIDAWLAFTGTPLITSANQIAGSGGLALTEMVAPIWDSSAVQFLQFIGMLNSATVNGTAFGQAAAAGGLPVAALSSAQTVPVGAASASLAGSAGSVSAGLGRAGAVGGLSVPQSWAQAAPGIRLAGAALPAGGVGAVPAAGLAGAPGGWMMPNVAGAINAPRSGGEADTRYLHRMKVLPQAAGKAGADTEVASRWASQARVGVEALGPLTGEESRELDELRRGVADLALKRDAVTFLLKELSRS